ncbi:glycosyltransferase family 4 protein [Vibrio fluvialis]|nr:glycosyltransferase family 4 protein [Vibrio fluvialis]MBL4253704.1 glycosyltransferase family 4 protein [Vibrio fluvialis]
MINNHRGMGRFAQFFIKPILSDLVALAPQGTNACNYRVVSRGNAFFPWWEQVILPTISNDERLDFLILPYNTGPILRKTKAKQISIIHDLIFMRDKRELPLSTSIYQTLGRYYRRFVVPRIAKNSDIIITVSEYTKSELIEQLGVAENKIKVIPNSIKDEWFCEPLPHESRGSYLFTVAGEAPSKNVITLLKSFSLAIDTIASDIKLVIAGIKVSQQEPFAALCKELGIESRVEFLGFLSDEELQQRYREAKAFVFASLFEGFGIPVLEAMASGTPVCCSNTTSLPEVAGDAAFYFNPRNTKEMANQIAVCLNSSTEEKTIRVSVGRQRAALFSQQYMDQKVREFWREYCGIE